MKNFITGWHAIDQTVAVMILITLLAGFVTWVLYGEHKYGGSDERP